MTTEQQTPKASPLPEPPRPRPGNRSAALAVWTWRAAEGTPKETVSEASAARREGLVRGIVGGVVGTLIFLFWHKTLAFVVWGIAGFTLLAALLSPTGIYRGIQKVVSYLVFGVGWLLSWLLLPIFFFGFCFVFGLLARRGKKDRMERWFEDGKASYWKSRNDPERDVKFYERQF